MERGHTTPYSSKQTVLGNNTGILRILERLLEQTNTSQMKQISFDDPSPAICPSFLEGCLDFTSMIFVIIIVLSHVHVRDLVKRTVHDLPACAQGS